MIAWISTISSTELIFGGIVAMLIALCVLLLLQVFKLEGFVTNLRQEACANETQSTVIQFHQETFGPLTFRDTTEIRIAALALIESYSRETTRITERLMNYNHRMPILAPTRESLAALQMNLWRLGELFNISVQEATNSSLRAQRHEIRLSVREIDALFPVPDSKLTTTRKDQ